MLIEHKEYIALIDEIEFLKKDNVLLKQENSILAEQLLEAKAKIEQLSEHHRENMELIKTLHSKSVSHQSHNTKEIISEIVKKDLEIKEFLDKKFFQLENSTIEQKREIKEKINKSNLDIYELTDFVNKLRSIHKETSSPDVVPSKKLSLLDLKKWVKSLALVCLSQQKIGVTGSYNTVNSKKQSDKSVKMEENQETLNSVKSQVTLKMY